MPRMVEIMVAAAVAVQLAAAAAAQSATCHPLLVAIINGEPEKVKSILEGNPKLAAERYAESENGEVISEDISPLCVALICEEEEIAIMLLDKGADPNDYNVNKYALHIAIENNFISAVRKMLALGAHKKVFDLPDMRTSLHVAAQHGREEIAYMLMKGEKDRKFFLEAADNAGRRPIHYAAQSGNPRILLALLHRIRHFDDSDSEFRSPLFWAVRRSVCVKSVLLLLERGADMRRCDKRGDTVVHEAARKPKNQKLLVALVEHAEREYARQARARRRCVKRGDGGAERKEDAEREEDEEESEEDEEESDEYGGTFVLMNCLNLSAQTPLDMAENSKNEEGAAYVRSHGGLRYRDIPRSRLRYLLPKFE